MNDGRATAAAGGPRTESAFDVAAVRREFPILAQTVHGHPLIYLDNAATTQKPRVVIDTVASFYSHSNSNVHRGVHALSIRATEIYEAARAAAQRFLGAASPEEIVFVRGATEAINLVASTFARARVSAGDEVLITEMEHHSNIVPWQMLCAEKGATLSVAPMDDAGDLILEEFEKRLGPRTRLAAVTHMSNALGTINPIFKIVEVAHAHGVPVLVDGAQAAAHLPVDVAALGCDFYAFSSHKVYGPSGLGVLYGRLGHLAAMPPYQGGGDMILNVTFEKTTYNKPPHRFEAGTPNMAGAAGMAAALEWVTRCGRQEIARHEEALTRRAVDALSAIEGLRLIGTPRVRAGVISFVVDGIHPHDLGTILDREGIAIRTGHHCAQPVMEHFGVPATARASVAAYNTPAEIDALAEAVSGAALMFRR